MKAPGVVGRGSCRASATAAIFLPGGSAGAEPYHAGRFHTRSKNLTSLTMNSHISLLMVALTAFSTSVLLGAEPVPNPSFEVADGLFPRGWHQERWGGEGTSAYADVGHTGNHSVQLASDTGADISWSTTVPVVPFARYRLTGWIRTEDVKVAGGRGALINLHNLQPAATKAVTGSADWTRVETEFDAADNSSVQINCLLGGWGLATGKAWFDDLGLEKIGERTPPTIWTIVDKQPISR